MGLISKALILIFSFLLFISLIFGAVSFTIYASLEYEEVQKNVAPFAEDFLRENIITKSGEINKNISITERVLDAVLNSAWGKEIPFTEKIKQSLEEKLNSGKGDNVSLQQEAQELIYEIYYKEYECVGYKQCSDKYEVPLFLISQQARNYWYKNFKYTCVFGLALVGILFLLVSKKRNLFILVGILSLLTSLVLLGAKKVFSDSIIKVGNEVFGIFFNKLSYVITFLAAAGIILIALAIIFGLFGLGFKIFSWIDSINVRLPKSKKKTMKEKRINSSYSEPLMQETKKSKNQTKKIK